jgi:hypothetical protein
LPPFCKSSELISAQVRFLVIYLFPPLHSFYRLGTPLQAQKTLVHCIENGLFALLNQEHKIALCETLLDVGSQDLSAVGLVYSLFVVAIANRIRDAAFAGETSIVNDPC